MWIYSLQFKLNEWKLNKYKLCCREGIIPQFNSVFKQWVTLQNSTVERAGADQKNRLLFDYTTELSTLIPSIVLAKLNTYSIPTKYFPKAITSTHNEPRMKKQQQQGTQDNKEEDSWTDPIRVSLLLIKNRAKTGLLIVSLIILIEKGGMAFNSINRSSGELLSTLEKTKSNSWQLWCDDTRRSPFVHFTNRSTTLGSMEREEGVLNQSIFI